jgi:hypothetical protein
MDMSDLLGAEFLSGDDMMGDEALLGLLSGGTMSDIAGDGFVSGADPVSALLGLDDIAGDDMLGMSLKQKLGIGAGVAGAAGLGALLLARRRKQAITKAAINQKLIRGGAAVVARHNQKARRYPCPLPATVVAGGASATITARPQALYRPERLVIAASIAPSFSVTDIKVGNVSQIPNTGEIPGEMFAQNGVDCTIQLDTVNPAIDLLVVVTNITGGNLTFRGAFIGTNVQ